MNTVGDLFERCGGPARVGRAIGVKTEHASSMKRRDSIPAEYWVSLVEWAAMNDIEGITYEALALLHAKPAGDDDAAQPAAGAAQ